MTSKSLKVIFDTNVWISFLIGKRLSRLKNKIIKQLPEVADVLVHTEPDWLEV